MDGFANELIVAGVDSKIGVIGMAFPLDGSAPRKLARVGNAPYTLLGIDEQGICSFDYVSETQSVMHLAPADGGSVQPFWPGIPRQYLPTKLRSDGNGGHLVAGDELFDDGVFHKSLFVVDSQGNRTRVACDANREAAVDSLEARPAFADDAIYVYNVDRSGVLDADASTPPEMSQIIKIPYLDA